MAVCAKNHPNTPAALFTLLLFLALAVPFAGAEGNYVGVKIMRASEKDTYLTSETIDLDIEVYPREKAFDPGLVDPSAQLVVMQVNPDTSTKEVFNSGAFPLTSGQSVFKFKVSAPPSSFSVGSGVYTFIAKVTESARQGRVLETLISDNSSSRSYRLLAKKTKNVPEMPPIFAMLLPLAVLVLLGVKPKEISG